MLNIPRTKYDNTGGFSVLHKSNFYDAKSMGLEIYEKKFLSGDILKSSIFLRWLSVLQNCIDVDWV